MYATSLRGIDRYGLVKRDEAMRQGDDDFVLPSHLQPMIELREKQPAYSESKEGIPFEYFVWPDGSLKSLSALSVLSDLRNKRPS